MKHFLLIIITLLFINHSVFSQVDDIKDKADENQENRDNNSHGGGGYGDSYTSSPCSDACVDVCFDLFFSVAFELLIEHHTDIIHRPDELPAVTSLEIMPHFGYNPDNDYVNALPRIRGNWGVFSTDFRFNYLAEFDDNMAEVYKMWEWQIIEFNIVPSNKFRTFIGFGLLYEDYTGTYYNENSLGFQLASDDRQIIANLEGRSTWDYETGSHVFSEVNFRGGYRFIHFKHLDAHLNIGLIYQQYYADTNTGSAVKQLMLQSGLTFTIY